VVDYRYLGDSTSLIPGPITTISGIAFQIKERRLLTSIHAFCSIGQSEQ